MSSDNLHRLSAHAWMVRQPQTSADGGSYYRQALTLARSLRFPRRFRTDLIRHDRLSLLTLDPSVDRIGLVLYTSGSFLARSSPAYPVPRETCELLLDSMRDGGACFIGERGRLRPATRAEFCDFLSRAD